jgi:hypothetical protein
MTYIQGGIPMLPHAADPASQDDWDPDDATEIQPDEPSWGLNAGEEDEFDDFDEDDFDDDFDDDFEEELDDEFEDLNEGGLIEGEEDLDDDLDSDFGDDAFGTGDDFDDDEGDGGDDDLAD